MKHRLFLPALALAMALQVAPALAFGCPVDMAAIDKALAAGPNLSAAQLEQVTKLRAEGESQHKAGQHAASLRTLAKAKEILGIE